MLPSQQPSSAPAEPIKVPIRDAATAQQVNTILGIFGMTMSALNSITRLDFDMDDNDEGEERRVLTGETRVAAETTFINCCETLDTILKDKSRWSLAQQDRIERERQQAQNAQIRYLEASASAAAEVTTPHFRFHPSIARATDGDWIAFVGDPEDLTNAIVGAGKSPQEALADFDAKFAGEMPAAVTQWLEDREQKLNQGLPLTDPFPKVEQNEVDDRTGQSTDDAEEGGQDGQRDSGDDGSELPASD